MTPIQGFVFSVSAGATGAILHEALHWLVAHAVGARKVGFEWGGWLSKTYVTYEIDANDRLGQIAINLSPQVMCAGLTGWLLIQEGAPTATFTSLSAISFLAGLGLFGGREDFKSLVA